MDPLNYLAEFNFETLRKNLPAQIIACNSDRYDA